MAEAAGRRAGETGVGKEFRKVPKTALDAEREIPYSHPLMSHAKHRTGDGLCRKMKQPIHVDGSASGDAAKALSLRTAKRLPARMEVGGTLRTYLVFCQSWMDGLGAAAGLPNSAENTVECPIVLPSKRD